MSSVNKRDPVYFIDCSMGGKKAYVESGNVLHYNEATRKVTVMLFNEDYRYFKLRDYRTVVFPTREQAQALVDKQPEIGQTVFCVEPDNGKVTEEVAVSFQIPYIYFESGKRLHVMLAEKEFFLTRENANAILGK